VPRNERGILIKLKDFQGKPSYESPSLLSGKKRKERGGERKAVQRVKRKHLKKKRPRSVGDLGSDKKEIYQCRLPNS